MFLNTVYRLRNLEVFDYIYIELTTCFSFSFQLFCLQTLDFIGYVCTQAEIAALKNQIGKRKTAIRLEKNAIRRARVRM
jgi:hypothetical protein